MLYPPNAYTLINWNNFNIQDNIVLSALFLKMLYFCMMYVYTIYGQHFNLECLYKSGVITLLL